MKLMYIILFLTFTLAHIDLELPCRFLLSTLKKVLTSSFFTSIYMKYEELQCKYDQYPYDYCKNISFYQYQHHYIAIINTIIDPDTLCCDYNLCNEKKFEPDPDLPFIKRVGLNTKPFIKNSYISGGERIRFAVFADLHIDYDYEEVNKVVIVGTECEL